MTGQARVEARNLAEPYKALGHAKDFGNFYSGGKRKLLKYFKQEGDIIYALESSFWCSKVYRLEGPCVDAQRLILVKLLQVFIRGSRW